jgi:hypothetical protein
MGVEMRRTRGRREANIRTHTHTNAHTHTHTHTHKHTHVTCFGAMGANRLKALRALPPAACLPPPRAPLYCVQIGCKTKSFTLIINAPDDQDFGQIAYSNNH